MKMLKLNHDKLKIPAENKTEEKLASDDVRRKRRDNKLAVRSKEITKDVDTEQPDKYTGGPQETISTEAAVHNLQRHLVKCKSSFIIDLEDDVKRVEKLVSQGEQVVQQAIDQFRDQVLLEGGNNHYTKSEIALVTEKWQVYAQEMVSKYREVQNELEKLCAAHSKEGEATCSTLQAIDRVLKQQAEDRALLKSTQGQKPKEEMRSMSHGSSSTTNILVATIPNTKSKEKLSKSVQIRVPDK